MELTKMSSRGQLVLPKTIRKQIGADKHTQFFVEAIGSDAVILKKVDQTAFLDWLQTLPPVENIPTMQEIVDEVRGVRKELAKERRHRHKRTR